MTAYLPSDTQYPLMINEEYIKANVNRFHSMLEFGLSRELQVSQLQKLFLMLLKREMVI